MNMFKKNGGFTLVELIVVIVILAILAGAAVPAYSGYISKAQEANDLTQLDSVKTAAVFAAMKANADAVVTKIVVTEAAAGAESKAPVVKINDATTATDVSDFVPSFEFKSDNNQAVWSSTGGNANKWVLSKVG